MSKTKQERDREYYLKHRDALIQKQKKYYEQNRNKIQEYYKAYRQKNWEELKPKRAKYVTNRRQQDPLFRLKCNLRSRLYRAIRAQKTSRSGKTFQLIGCTNKELKVWLESKFQEGMTWDNYGEWHVDHIIPCSSFDLLDPVEQQKCFHYTNLQPLWAEDNLRKSNNGTIKR